MKSRHIGRNRYYKNLMVPKWTTWPVNQRELAGHRTVDYYFDERVLIEVGTV